MDQLPLWEARRKYDVQISNVVIQQFIQNSSKDSKMQDLQKRTSKHNGRWTKEEHLKFLQGLRIYGKNWKKIEQLVETRSGSQIRSHAQKFFLKGKTEEGTQESNMCQFSGDFGEEPESITGNSKSVGEGIYKKDDLSYFLTRIVEYSTGKTSLNFWQDMVDCKDATDSSQLAYRKNSFTSFGDEDSKQEFQESTVKKVQA